MLFKLWNPGYYRADPVKTTAVSLSLCLIVSGALPIKAWIFRMAISTRLTHSNVNIDYVRMIAWSVVVFLQNDYYVCCSLCRRFEEQRVCVCVLMLTLILMMGMLKL